MKNKALCLFLAFCLCLGLCVPAFAKPPETTEELYNCVKLTRTVQWRGESYDCDEIPNSPFVIPGYWVIFDGDNSHFYVGNRSCSSRSSFNITHTGDDDFYITIAVENVYKLLSQSGEGTGLAEGIKIGDHTLLSDETAYLCDDRNFHSAASVESGEFRVFRLNAGESKELPLYDLFRNYQSGGNLYTLMISAVGTEDDEQKARLACAYVTDDREERNLCARLIPAPKLFDDVPGSAYFYDTVQWALENNITKGVTENLFAPNNPCTRAQVMTFIWRYFGQPEPTIANPYTDVAQGAYFYKAALWAYEKGMVTGSEFGGGTPCARAEAVTYFWILEGRPDVIGDLRQYGTMEIPGVAQDAPYRLAAEFALSANITSFSWVTGFEPDRICTRAHIVTFLQRYDEYLTAKRNAG